MGPSATSQPEVAETKLAEEVASTEPKVVEKKRLTYHEQKEWDQLEPRIEQLENRLSEIEGEMIQHGSNFDQLSLLQIEKEERTEELEQLMERWEALASYV
ncbi:ABC transporter C-terminal domain-containing protein [Atopobacter phocae]|uniref:ABC transporter C-terminal domain-containing protein n=1 Tax=Atopobacter phocae TaxID=136492 RepID=UPI003CCB76EF